MSMSKTDLIAAMAEKTGITKADTEKMLNAFISVVQGELTQGEQVRLDGIGILAPVIRKGRTGRNPQTGAPVAIPEKVAIKFKIGADLARMMNK